MQEKRFVKGSAKKKVFDNGWEVIRVELSLTDLMRLPMTWKCYVSLNIASKKDWPDQYWNTHNISLNDYDPQGYKNVNDKMVKVADYFDWNTDKLHIEEWKDDSWNDLPF
jgi:hypothetical protein